MIISFEGLDGSGKSTQIEFLVNNLTQRGYHVGVVKEPGGSFLGEKIRELVTTEKNLDPWAEAYLFMASRAQCVNDLIKVAYKDKDVILCDRYIDSSVVYQGIARGLGIENIWNLSKPSLAGCYPDTTIYIRVPYEVCLARIKQRGEADRIENMGEAFFKKLQEGYDAISEKDPERWITIDGNKKPEAVAENVALALMRRYTSMYLRL